MCVQKRTRFTLIELLVVVAIVTILMSILLPALMSAKMRAKDLSCITNMNQIALLEFQYVDDHDGFIQKSRYNTISGRPSNTGDLFWQDVLMPYYQPTIYTQKLCYKKWPRVSYGGRNYRRPKEIFDCPSIQMSTLDYLCDTYSSNFSADNHNKVGIGFNSNCLTAVWSGVTYGRRINKIQHSSKVFMLMDMLGDSATDHGGSANCLSAGHWSYQMWRSAYGIPPRHGGQKRLNVTFFDGHVSAERYDDLPENKNTDTDVGSWAYK